MSNVLVKIISVQPDAQIPKRDGGTYSGMQLTYESGGRTITKGIHQSVLQKNPALEAKFKELQPGQEAAFVLQKNGNFTNITDVLPASQASAPAARTGGTTRTNTRTATNPKDVARIARQTAVTAAATFCKDAESTVQAAEVLATFILAPLGVDSTGNTVTTTVPTAETTGGVDEDLPF